MRAVVLYAHGSPCPTLVLPGEALPADERRLTAALRGLREALPAPERDRILKIALVSPSTEDGFDLDYRFVQCLAGGDGPEFEFRGSCGHSILAAVVGGYRLGLTPQPSPGLSVRVRVCNNDDDVTCTVDDASDHAGRPVCSFTARFAQRQPPTLASLLMFDEPVTYLRHDGGWLPVSGVSAGNPYVFVDARALGLAGGGELFGAGADLFRTLSGIQRAAQRDLGWSPGAFPKVAALARVPGGGLAARAVSIPSWHPTLALTGATCLAAAVAVADTIPGGLVAAPLGPLRIVTAGGRIVAHASVTGRERTDVLRSVSISDKVVEYLMELQLPGADRRPGRPAGRAAGARR